MDNFMFWLQVVISILSGIAVCIPLGIKLVQYIKATIKEKNWDKILTLLLDLMAEAEEKFVAGVDKKEFVMAELRALSKAIDYDIDWEVISKLIDDLCAMSKKVNVKGEID